VRLSQVIACLRRLLKFVVELLLLFPVLVPFARRRPASFTLFPYTTLFRSRSGSSPSAIATAIPPWARQVEPGSSGTRTVARGRADRKSTRLNSSHVKISYAVFCLKEKAQTALPSSGNQRNDQSCTFCVGMR